MPHRVCHVITMLEMGGAQQNTLYTVAHLDPARFEASLVTGPGGILDQDAAAMAGVKVHFQRSLQRSIRPLRDLRALAELTTYLRRAAPAIVHTHSSKAGILGRWAAYLAGVPHIVHSIHGFGFTPGQPAPLRGTLIAAERAAARLTSRFIAVSEANRREGAALGLFEPDRCVLIRSGIELAKFRNGDAPAGAVRAELGIGPNVPLAGMVACLKPQKAPEDFVAVAAQVAQLVPQAQFVLVGDGELRAPVERAIRAARLEGKVHLLGWRRDVHRILKDLDVLVLTSRWEGLPRVFPEAMAAGVPIVASRVDGAPEAVHDGDNGYLCDPGDVAAIAARLSQLLADLPRAREMGARGRLRAREWDIDEMVRRQEALYEELLATTPQRRPAHA